MTVVDRRPNNSPTSDAADFAVEVKNLSVTFKIDRRTNHDALTDVSLDIRRGEFVAIVGKSGSGKSTLLRIIAGLRPATDGDVIVDGEPVVGPPPQVRYLFQDYRASLLPWKSVRDSVIFGLKHSFRATSDLDDKAVADALLEQVGLVGISDRHPPQLSGGMQQRVALARAIAANPEVLLLDEAFGSVDALSRAHLQDTLLKIWHDWHLTIVFVTHDIDEAIYLADRVVVLAADGTGIDADVTTGLQRPRDQIATRAESRFLEARAALLELVLKTDGVGS